MMSINASGVWQIIDSGTGKPALDADGVWPLEYYDVIAAQVEANRLTTSTGRRHTVVKVADAPKPGRNK